MPKNSPSGASPLNSSLHTKYQKTVLTNGIRIVTETIPYVRSVSCGVWIDVGSRDEDEEMNGISHFIEHMVFKGTKKYSNLQIARSLESVGGYLNAFTTKEHTCFYARILDAHMNKAIDVLSDIVQHPIFDPKEIEKERSVVLEELKNIEDDPDDIIHDYLERSVYYKHPLGFPVIGRADSIRKFNRDNMFHYMKNHFLPERMVVAAAGNLVHEKLVEEVDARFKVRGVKREFHRQQGPRENHSSHEVFERPHTQAYVCIGTIGYSVRNKLRYPLLVLNTMLGDGMSSRLFQNIREKYGFAYAVYSFANLLSDTGNFGVYIGTDNENVDRSLDLIYKEFSSLREKGSGRAELERTKTQMKGSMMLGLENMSNRMMRLGSSELYFREFLTLDDVIRKIDNVHNEHIAEVANKLLRKENFSTVIFKGTNGKTG
jgi:predicted Zn-dependent peptidase